jgi:hypothetical protein
MTIITDFLLFLAVAFAGTFAIVALMTVQI